MAAIELVEGIDFDWLDPGRYAFALGLEAAGATWVAGQTAARYDPAEGRVVVTGDAGAQANVCWAKVEAVLAAAGRRPSESTEVVEYLTADGLADREAVAAARPSGVEATSTVIVESLVRPTAAVEVEVVAGGPADLVRLPQLLPIDSDGEVIAPGDLVGQSEWVLIEAGRRLAEHGLELGDVVRTVQQTTPATRSEYRATGAARAELLGPQFPGSTGILTSALPHPDVLVAIDVWASREPKSVVAYATNAYEPLTFSPAVTAGNVVYISGTTAWDPTTGETVGETVGAQAEFVYDQIRRVCEAAGGDLSNLVKTIEYITPAAVDDYRSVAAVRTSMLPEPLPVSTGVVVAGLLSRRWLIEVEAVAVLG